MKFVFFVLIGALLISGCQSSLERKVWDNIAEIRQFVVYGKEEGISASLTCGRREFEYKLNGYATDLIEFGVITIMLDDIDKINFESADYVLFVGTKKYEGDLQKNPFDNTLVADIKKIVSYTENISLELYIDKEKIDSLKLKRVDADWQITYDDCVALLVGQYKKELKSLIKKSEFEGEVYIKILNDFDKNINDFYYYVSVVGRSGDTLSIIISPKTGNILACNNTIVA